MSIRCAHQKTPEFGCQDFVIDRVDWILGAYELENRHYDIYLLPSGIFRQSKRPSPVNPLLGLVRRSIFIEANYKIALDRDLHDDVPITPVNLPPD